MVLTVQPHDEDDDQVAHEGRLAPQKSGRDASSGRRLQLVRLLTAQSCTREDIFRHLEMYYVLDRRSPEQFAASLLAAERMLERDIQFLTEQGFEIYKTRATRSQPAVYHLKKGSGTPSIFLFTDTEVETLAFLSTLFADPTEAFSSHPSQPLPFPPARNPFADDILALIQKLSAALPASQRQQFQNATRKPFVYFHISPVANYLPVRAVIDTIVNAIAQHRQIAFRYLSPKSPQAYTLHQHVDPYYVVYTEGHFYLVAYSHQWDKIFEYRLDRIQEEHLHIQFETIDVERRRKPVEFTFWIESNMIKQGLSYRWLSHTPLREETSLDEEGKPRKRTLIRATAYSKWRIVQQLLRYGEKAELVSPPDLRADMQRVVQLMGRTYK